MKLRFVALSLLLLALAGLAGLTLTATSPIIAAPLAAGPAAPAADAAATYWIPLPLPDPASVEVPAGSQPWHAAGLAQALLDRRLQPLLAELVQLQAQGRITTYAFDPAAGAVKVAAPDAAGPLAAVAAHAGADAPLTQAPASCGGDAAAALEAIVRTAIERQRAAGFVPGAGAAGVAGAAAATRTNPSIDLYLLGDQPIQVPGPLYGYIAGLTDPGVPVTLAVLRGTAVVVSEQTTSGATGAYVFYPSYRSCGTGLYYDGQTTQYGWSLRMGDRVQVTAGQRSAEMLVAPLSAWADPASETVAGSTDPGRTVWVDLSQPKRGERCGTANSQQAVLAGADGQFSLSFATPPTGTPFDFDSAALAQVCSRDPDLNGVCTAVPAFRVGIIPNAGGYPGGSTVVGQVKPRASFAVRLLRQGNLVVQASGTAGGSGYVEMFLPEEVRSGDQVQLTSDGVDLTYSVSLLNVDQLDPEHDEAVLVADAGQQLALTFGQRRMAACSPATVCVSAGTGAHPLPVKAPFDVRSGDYVDVISYDAAGNFHDRGYTNAPALLAHTATDWVEGYWPGTSGVLAVWLTDTRGDRVASASARLNYDGSFSASLPQFSLKTGYQVTAAEGSRMRTMTLPDVTVRFDAAAGTVSGRTLGGRLVGRAYENYRCTLPRAWSAAGTCREQDAGVGQYALHFDGLEFRGGDQATVTMPDAAGNYVDVESDAFQVRYTVGSEYIYGQSAVNGDTVRGELWRGGTRVATCSAVSHVYWWSCGLGHLATNSATIDPAAASESAPAEQSPYVTPGDLLKVSTGAGEGATLQVFDLTAAGQNDPPAVTGQWLAGQTVGLYYWEEMRYTTSPAVLPAPAALGSSYLRTTVDAGGRYNLSMAGLRFRSTGSADICRAPRPGGGCASFEVTACYPEGHTGTRNFNPAWPGPDAFEPDNWAQYAQSYLGIPQHHSFSEVYDRDWVRFEAGPEAARITMTGLRVGALQDVAVYTADGGTMLALWRFYSSDGQDIAVTWTPPAHGEYLLLISRPYDLSFVPCIEVYDLRIDRAVGRMYLPLMVR